MRRCAPRWTVSDPLGAAGEDLQAIRRANLFLVPLDNEGTWFRYHHLFRYLLQNQLRQVYGEAEMRAMHARASAWFAGQGLLDEAIDYALQAGEPLRAASLVEDHVHEALDREDWRQVERWIGLLPAEVLSRPRLLVTQAWLAYIRYHFAAISALLAAAEAALAKETGLVAAGAATLPGEIATLRATVAYNNNDAAGTVRWAALAMQRLKPEMQYAMGLATLFYICGLQASGQYAEAVTFAHRQIDVHATRPALLLRILLALCSVHNDMADVFGMQSVATPYELAARQFGLGLSVAWSNYAQGWLHYQRNQLAQAEQRFRTLAASASHGRAILDGATGLALTLLAQGHPDQALAAVAVLRDQLLEREMLALLPVAESLRQRVLLHSAGPDLHYQAPGTQVPIEFWEQPVLTQVRTLLARGAPEDPALAKELLARLRARVTARNSRRTLIEIDALQALVYAAQGDEPAALAALRQAVETGRAGRRAATAGGLRTGADRPVGATGQRWGGAGLRAAGFGDICRCDWGRGADGRPRLGRRRCCGGCASRGADQPRGRRPDPVSTAALGQGDRRTSRSGAWDRQEVHVAHLPQAGRRQPPRRGGAGSPLGPVLMARRAAQAERLPPNIPLFGYYPTPPRRCRMLTRNR